MKRAVNDLVSNPIAKKILAGEIVVGEKFVFEG